MEPDNILDEIEEAIAYIPPVSMEPGTWQAAALIRTITLFSDHPAARPSHLDQHHISAGHFHDDRGDARRYFEKLQN